MITRSISSSRRASWISLVLPFAAITALSSVVVVETGSTAFAQSEEEMNMMDEEMDMMDEDMYMMDGDPSGMGSGGRSGYGGRNQSSAQASQARMMQAITSLMTATDLVRMTDAKSAPPVASGPVLLNEALVANRYGEQSLALQLYFGHIVAEFKDVESELRSAKYSALMKRPVWRLRWGVSFAVRGDATDPQPIKDTPGRRAGGGMEGMGMEGMGMEGMGMEGMGMEGMGMEGMGMEGMGMEGMEMEGMGMEGMDEMGMGMGGMGMGMGMRNRSAAPAGPPTPAARLAALEKTMLSEKAGKELVDSLGLVATVVGEEFDKRFSQGDFGSALIDATPESGDTATVAGAFVDLLESAPGNLPMWRPGIVFVGKGDSKDNAAVARAAGLDLLIHFDVLLKPGRGTFVQNISRCRLIHVPTNKSLGVSKPFDSLEVAQQSRTKGQASRAYVEEQLSNFLGIIDRQAKAIKLPQLTAAVARGRVGSLLGAGGGKNLRTLAEVRLFQSLGLLTDDEVLMAFDIVGGSEGMQMIFGSEEERLNLVRTWAGKAIQ